MNKTLQWAGILGMIIFFAAVLSSCSSSRQLGCPTKITQQIQPVPPNLC